MTKHYKRWIAKIYRILNSDYCPVMLPYFKFKEGQENIDYIHQLALSVHARSKKTIILFTFLWPIIAMIKTSLSVYRYSSFVQKQYHVSYQRQWKQIFYLAIRQNITPTSYYEFRLWNELNYNKANLYIQHHEITVILPWLNKNKDTSQFKDKATFYHNCLSYRLPTIPIIAGFKKGNQVEWFCDGEEFPPQDIFIKNSELWGGIGGEKWKYCSDGEFWERNGKQLNHADLVKYCLLSSTKRSVIVQPLLKNHPKIEPFTNGSVCTLRIVTYKLPQQSPMMLIATLRMPVGNGEVDNFAHGGIASAVSATGILSPAVEKKENFRIFSHHPDTQHPLEGEVLPFWEDMLNLALLAHECFSLPHFIGWDIAVTSDGPILIEGNTTWAVEVLQMPHNQPLGETAFVDIFSTAVKIENMS